MRWYLGKLSISRDRCWVLSFRLARSVLYVRLGLKPSSQLWCFTGYLNLPAPPFPRFSTGVTKTFSATCTCSAFFISGLFQSRSAALYVYIYVFTDRISTPLLCSWPQRCVKIFSRVPIRAIYFNLFKMAQNVRLVYFFSSCCQPGPSRHRSIEPITASQHCSPAVLCVRQIMPQSSFLLCV